MTIDYLEPPERDAYHENMGRHIHFTVFSKDGSYTGSECHSFLKMNRSLKESLRFYCQLLSGHTGLHSTTNDHYKDQKDLFNHPFTITWNDDNTEDI